MCAAWGTCSVMYNEDDEDLALMAIEEWETEPKSDSEGMEVNLFDLKDKLVSSLRKNYPSYYSLQLIQFKN